MSYIVLISKDYPNIAREELERLLSVKLTPYVDGYFFTENIIDFSLVKRLGLTREIYEILDYFQTGDESAVLEKLNTGQFENSYKIDVIGFEGITKDVKAFADKIYHKLQSPKVDIKNPDNKYVFFWSLTEVRLAKLVFENKDSPHDRRSHLKEHNHPTSIHPKIAKAMINMGAKKEFLDPFCGAGGIVIEGALMGLKVKGSDIDKAMVVRAKENALAYDLDLDLEVNDALRLTKKTECIITDLPYGKNSKISSELVNLYCDFFAVADSLTDTIIVGSHEDTDIDAYLDETNFEVYKEFPIYVHKSMTRTISILKKMD
ncbi:hypothetical protein JXA48_01410 [Candidatus Woesearchaeota archaeon]|nr:hypothetical protein [Candidatus Woesearchaeota archaeon]